MRFGGSEKSTFGHWFRVDFGLHIGQIVLYWIGQPGTTQRATTGDTPMTASINPSDYNLLDSDTSDVLSTEDLHCTYQEYAEAIRESLSSDQPEGHMRVHGRRVYAMPV